MSKDPISEGEQDVSRRGLLQKAALAVGAATSVVAARSALARSGDVLMDSAGRVLINGAALATQSPEGSFEVAAGSSNANNCTNGSSCSGSQNSGSCTNQASCVAPRRAMQPIGAGQKMNAPPGGGLKMNAPPGGGLKMNAPTGGGRK
jgi:hypothetical protein